MLTGALPSPSSARHADQGAAKIAAYFFTIRGEAIHFFLLYSTQGGFLKFDPL